MTDGPETPFVLYLFAYPEQLKQKEETLTMQAAE